MNVPHLMNIWYNRLDDLYKDDLCQYRKYAIVVVLNLQQGQGIDFVQPSVIMTISELVKLWLSMYALSAVRTFKRRYLHLEKHARKIVRMN